MTRDIPSRCARSRPKRPATGFTLIEVLLSVTILSTLMGAMMSAILISRQAIDNGDSLISKTVAGREAIDEITADLQLASSVTEATATAITFTVPDRTGDDVSETIRYAWSGTPGDPLTRTFNGTTVDFVNDVHDLDFTYLLRTIHTSPEAVLLAHWKFDESSGSIATDSTGHGYDGTLVNGPTWTSGVMDGAIELDGIDDYVEVPGFPNLTTSFTMTAWVRLTATDGDQRILADDRNNAGGFAISIGDGGDGKVRFFSRGITPESLDSTSPVIGPNTWHHVAGVHDADRKKRFIYVDGVLVAEDLLAYGGSWGTDPHPTSIGGEIDGTSESVPNWRLGGKIDDVRVYGRALTAKEISGIMGATPTVHLDHPIKPRFAQGPASDALVTAEAMAFQDFTRTPNCAAVTKCRTGNRRRDAINSADAGRQQLLATRVWRTKRRIRLD